MDLKNIDLNLMMVFRQLLIDRSVTRAADNLGVSQPAVSNALSRLRKLFANRLFVRTLQGMEPTPFAAQLAGPVSNALDLIHIAINQNVAFDPSISSYAFKIGMTDIGEICFLPSLMEKLLDLAPGVSISTVRNSAVNLNDEMAAGTVDMVIGYLPDMKDGAFQSRLFTQSYVCLLRRGHRLDKGEISLEDFSRADHVSVISLGTGHDQIDMLIDRACPGRKIRLTVPHFVALGYILSSTNMIATVPEYLARRMRQPFGLTYVPHPLPHPDIPINIFWHEKYNQDPANKWLRRVLTDMFRE